MCGKGFLRVGIDAEDNLKGDLIEIKVNFPTNPKYAWLRTIVQQEMAKLLSTSFSRNFISKYSLSRKE